MRIAIGADHRGVATKAMLISYLSEQQHELVDVGTSSQESVDYPDFAFQVATEVAAGRADRGILICGTGIGMSIAANKVPGIRAVVCHNTKMAQISRMHNDANVLCLSGDFVEDAENREIVTAWLETSFAGGRHSQRLDKIRECEAKAV